MDALDLTRRPPRSPRLLLGDLDLLMIARTVDKLRATLPGGNLGEYRIDGFSSRLLEKLGITEDALRAVVARAKDDAEVAEWIRSNTDPSKYEALNVAFEELKVSGRLNDPEWMARYPHAAAVDPEMARIDFLALDDARSFP